MSQRARRARVVVAWVLLVGSVTGWPATVSTLAKDEPPLVLALSWLAIIAACVVLLTCSQVHQQQGQSNRDPTS